MSYKTGGPAPPQKRLPGEGASDCSVEMASDGSANGPNAVDGSMGPGGKGSKGTASSSSPA